jgi:hypothetical protein
MCTIQMCRLFEPLWFGHDLFMDAVDKAKKLLEAKGYKVKKTNRTVAKTFQVSQTVLKDFLAVCDEKKLKIRPAIDQALTDWIKKQK